MKRYLAMLLIVAVALMCAPVAFGEVSADAVCQELARKLPVNFEGNETFSAESHYDASNRILVLELTSKKNDHAFFEGKRAIDDIQPLYDMLANLNVYSVCKEIMDEYSVEGVDIYFLAYSIDGVLEYIEINGKNLTDEFLILAETLMSSTPQTPQEIVDALVEVEKPNCIMTVGEYQEGTNVLILARALNFLSYDALMATENIEEIIEHNIQLSCEMRDALADIGETGIQAISVLYTFDETPVNVAIDGTDMTDTYREVAGNWITISQTGHLVKD